MVLDPSPPPLFPGWYSKCLSEWRSWYSMRLFSVSFPLFHIQVPCGTRSMTQQTIFCIRKKGIPLQRDSKRIRKRISFASLLKRNRIFFETVLNLITNFPFQRTFKVIFLQQQAVQVWQRLVASLEYQVSFAQEPDTKRALLQKRPGAFVLSCLVSPRKEPNPSLGTQSRAEPLHS